MDIVCTNNIKKPFKHNNHLIQVLVELVQLYNNDNIWYHNNTLNYICCPDDPGNVKIRFLSIYTHKEILFLYMLSMLQARTPNNETLSMQYAL